MVVFIIKRLIEENRRKEKKEKSTFTKKEMVDDKILMHPNESNNDIAALCGCSVRLVQQRRKAIAIDRE